jgi:adenosylhomocysteine nucleosidase
MICYAFPLAHEAAPLLKRCTQKETFSIGQLRCTLANFRDRRVLVALIGMGRTTAQAHAEMIFDYFRPRALILAGYGGALIPALKVGQIVVSTNYSSEEVVPFLRLLSGFDFVNFCTADEVVGTPARRDWHARSSKSQVIEMETAGVVAEVKRREIPFVAVRVISDDYATVLPVGALAAGFDAARGKPTPLRLLGHLATHPGEVVPFVRFVSNLSLARRNLTTFLQQMTDELPRNW